MIGRRIVLLIAGAIIAIAHTAAARPHKITHVVLDDGNPGETLSSGYSTIEQTTVRCSYYNTCTIAMRIMANVGQATCKGEWAIVGLVDGNSVDGGPLVEALPSAGNTQTNVWQGAYYTGSATETHTITFELYVPCPANANQWSVRYLITEP